MLKDGRYAAWFRTSRGQGTGVVDLNEGRISGSDSFFTYGGSYCIEEERFSAVLTVRRHADGQPSVFGLDEAEVYLSGVCNGLVATCSGAAREAPDVRFEATLIYSQEDAPVAEARLAVVKLKADKLPRGLDVRSRQRQSVASPKMPLS